MTIPDDATMSRLHADLVVKTLPRDAVHDPSVKPKVLVRDHSKFGTRIENARVDKDVAETEVAAQLPCRITFGVRIDNDTKRKCPTTVRLAYQPIALYLPVDFDDAYDSIARDCADAGVHLIRGLDAGCTHLLVPDPTDATNGVPQPFGPELAQRFIRGNVKPVTMKYLDAVRSRRDPAAPMPDPDSDAFAVPRDVVESMMGGATPGGADGGAEDDDDDATTDGEVVEDDEGEVEDGYVSAEEYPRTGAFNVRGDRGNMGAGPWASAGVAGVKVSAAAAAKAAAAEAARRAARDHEPGDGEEAGVSDEPRFVANIDDENVVPVAPIDFHTEGKATVVFESIPDPETRAANRATGGPRADDSRVNFKRFRKTVHGPDAAAREGGNQGRRARAGAPSANRGRGPVIRYADEVYDALQQWEDADVAAMHARQRRDAARAEDMFNENDDGGGGGAKGRAKPKAKPRAKAARR